MTDVNWITRMSEMSMDGCIAGGESPHPGLRPEGKEKGADNPPP
jgi:hypothetical protein